MGGKVLVPTSHFIRSLTAARLASDVMGAPTIIVARTDAKDANLITNDTDPRRQGSSLRARGPERACSGSAAGWTSP